MKRVTIAIVSVLLLCSSNLFAQTVTERADELLEQVNEQGIVQAVQSSDLSVLDVQLLELLMGMDLEGKEEAQEILHERIQEMPEMEFEVTGNQQQFENVSYMTRAAMRQLRLARMHRSGQTSPEPLPVTAIPMRTGRGTLASTTDRPGTNSSNAAEVAEIMRRLSYTVWVHNYTDVMLDEVVVFYQRYHSNHVLRAQHIGLLPDTLALLQMGPCFMMKHYTLGVYIGYQLVARVPPEGHNMTPAMASIWHPWDREPCLDAWEIGRSE